MFDPFMQRYQLWRQDDGNEISSESNSFHELTTIKLDGNSELLDYGAPHFATSSAALIIPGGQLGYVLDTARKKDCHGGAEFLRRYNAHVYALHKYTCADNSKPPVGRAAIRDVKRALKFIYDKHPNKRKILWGWSAGAWLALQVDMPVDLIISSYGVTSMQDDIAHKPTQTNALGLQATEAEKISMSVENRQSLQVGLVYMIHGGDDKSVSYEHTMRSAKALHGLGVPLRVVIPPKGRHGLLEAGDHLHLGDSIREAQRGNLSVSRSPDFEKYTENIKRGEFVEFQNYHSSVDNEV